VIINNLCENLSKDKCLRAASNITSLLCIEIFSFEFLILNNNYHSIFFTRTLFETPSWRYILSKMIRSKALHACI
jgi:hypothetical protein